MKVLVFGASGSQMGLVPAELIKLGHEVRAFSRQGKIFPGGLPVEPAMGDLIDFDSVRRAARGVDAMAVHIPFFGDPSKSLDYFGNIIRAAKEEGVGMLVWNTGGTIPAQPTGQLAIDFRLHALSELSRSGLTFVALAPTGYAENLLSPWTMVHMKTRGLVSYPTPADYRIGWLPTIDISRLVARTISRADLAGQVLDISGVESFNGRELARQFSLALGKTYDYYAMPPAEFGSILEKASGIPGSGSAAASFYQSMWDNPNFRPPMYFDQGKINKILPVERTSLLAWIAERAHLFS